MKAMILAAGIGTRLRPITNTKPKALVEIKGVPLVEHVLKRLIAFGVTEVIINLHHFPDQIIDFLRTRDNFGLRLEFSYEKKLLDTGGGLKKAEWFFNDNRPFFLHNVDVLSNIDLKKMMQFHDAQKNLATLAVNSRETDRYFIFDDANRLCGWKSLKTGETIQKRAPQGALSDQAFCGVHILSPEIFPKLTETGTFSIVDSYLRLAGEGERIGAFNVDKYRYLDGGKLTALTGW